MTREQLEHVLRAAAAITNQREFVVIGSQAVLASVPEPGSPLDQSMEVDLYPVDDPAGAALIDGTIGELSPFNETYGYYAHGVGPETATLPSRWRERAVRVENANTGGARGICPSLADLAASKLAAGREKDLRFVAAMLSSGLIRRQAVAEVLTELPDALRETVRARLDRA